MIELYAITDEGAPAPPDPLGKVAAGGLALVYAAAGDDDELSAERLWEHERVVEQLMAASDLLPVRYGTRAHDEVAAAEALLERRAELADALERVRGAVELSVRVVGKAKKAPVHERADTGAAYIGARAREAGARAHTANTVHEPLAQLARASSQRPDRGDGDLLRAAYLVDRDSVEPFVERVAELQAAHPELGLLCTGPWPAYSFSEA